MVAGQPLGRARRRRRRGRRRPVERVVEPLRVLRHGYQSWSPTAVATFGWTRTARGRTGSIAAHRHAPRRLGRAGARRAPQRAGHGAAGRDGGVLVAGFLGGREHDGTFRVRTARDGGEASSWRPRRSSAVPCSPAASGGSCTRSPLPRAMVSRPPCWRPGPVRWARPPVPAPPRRTRWVGAPGTTTSTTSPRPTCAPTWPGRRTGPSTSSSSTTASRPPSATGSPPTPSSRTEIDELAAAIAAEGRTPGSGSPRSSPRPTPGRPGPPRLARRAPARCTALAGLVEPPGGAARVNTLDTTNPEVLAHLEDWPARSSRPASLPEAGLHLRPVDRRRLRRPRPTPAQRVRAGYDAMRRGAGDGHVPARVRRSPRPLWASWTASHRRRRRTVWHPQAPSTSPAGYLGGEPATVTPAATPSLDRSCTAGSG